MIKIGKPRVTSDGKGKSRLSCDISVDQEKRELWIEVEDEYAQYFCTERCDAYVIGLLGWCMTGGHDIQSEVPITDELHYNLSTILIPTLVKHSPGFHSVRIIAPLEVPLETGGGVGAACSCGVDSFYTILQHSNSPYESMNLTHLCIFNVGGFNGYKNYGITRAKNESFARAKEVAEELGLRFIAVDSNFATTFIERYAFFHTYQDMMAVYALQKLWKIYYYSSTGWDYSHFSVVNTMNDSCAKYDLLSLQCFSTKYLRIYSDGGERDRIEKMEAIAREPIVQKNLRVCIRDREPKNCGKCIKCRRTLLMLDACGVLDAYREAFDLDYYREHIAEYYKWFYHTYTGDSNEKMFIEQIYMKLRDNPDYVAVAKRERLKDIIKAPIRPAYHFLKKLYSSRFQGNPERKKE